MSDAAVWDGLGKALLSERVSDAPSDRLSYALPGRPAPEGVIRITDAEMLVAVIKWAREHRKPLVPVSSSAPHYRASLKMPEGAVVVDLSGMKRVIAINRRNRVALFEAGLTFEELVPWVRRNGLRMMLPLMPRRGKSVLAAYLDREPVIYPRHQWDLADPLLCLEVVYGTGDLFRTGSAAGPGKIEEQWLAGEFQKNPMGPGQNDWMRIIQGAQGGIALATWCSAKCEVLPSMEKLLLAGSHRLEPLIETSYRLLYRKLTDIHFMVDRNALANLIAGNPADRERAARDAEAWTLVCSVTGIKHFAEERMGYLARECEKELKRQDASLTSPPLISEEEMLEMLLSPNPPAAKGNGTPATGVSPPPNWKDRSRGAHRSVFFQTTMDKVPGFVDRFDDMARTAGIRTDRISRYMQPQLGGRCCHVEFVVSTDPKDQADLENVHGFCQQAAGPLIDAGAFFSRPHGDWAEAAMKRAETSVGIYRKMKDIFDPDHILAPGRLTLGGDSHGRA
jgi:hypothetical protein